MELQSSLPCSQESITEIFPDSVQSSPHPQTLFKIRFNIIFPSNTSVLK